MKIYVVSPYRFTASRSEQVISSTRRYARRLFDHGHIVTPPFYFLDNFYSEKDHDLKISKALEMMHDCDEVHIMTGFGRECEQEAGLYLQYAKAIGKLVKYYSVMI